MHDDITGCNNNNHIFETKTVGVGENVALTCDRQNSLLASYMFWIRLVSGEVPEILGSTLSLDLGLNSDVQHHFTAKQEPGAFVLYITKTQLTDTAAYYCIKTREHSMEFLSGTFLRIKGPQPDITAIYQDPLPDPVHPGEAVTLHCSVLSSSERTSCLEEHHVYWFNTGPDESPPNLIYAQKNRGDECEQSPEAGSLQKCFYSFSKNVSSSDAGTYFCAVAACGEIMIGNGTKVEIEAVQTCDVQTVDVTVFIILCGALVLSLIIIAFLLYYIKKKKCDTTTAAVKPETNTVSATGFIQQSYEDSLVYHTPKFSGRRAGKAGRVRPNPPEKETVYSNIRIH
ncbi:signal-regulatory protein beta-2-like [Sphaeramia orbicularis]|uniref:signal-regulatory protein beta-2-like n=1 Tax=Sphaeramia orbicularis TaxID=375764 RepID=UPI00117FAD39|nr:signal-regulatory protein beta-2-like [Sphaeramia orbicularis]